jgi:hypothetical protein
MAADEEPTSAATPSARLPPASTPEGEVRANEAYAKVIV